MIRFVIVLSCLLVSSLAWAEDAAERVDEEYIERIAEGHRLYSNGAHQEALRAYRAALEEIPNDPMATYLVGCAQRALGQLDEALATFRSVVRLAGADDAAMHARALFNVALVQEARRDLVAATEAWQVYIAYAESHQNVPTYVANARQRLEAIQRVQELDTAYAPVRQRIADRAASEGSD